MRENIEWLIGQYTDKIEELERDGKSQSIGLTFINGQIRAYKIMVADLQSILDESEDEECRR
jgi:hypothetical protein